MSEIRSDAPSKTNPTGPAQPLTLRHYARRGETIETCSNVEIVDRQFGFVRCSLPYNYAYTSNSQQWSEAELICRALEGPMSAQGIMQIAPPAAGQDLDGQSQGRLVNYDLPPSEPDQGEVESLRRQRNFECERANRLAEFIRSDPAVWQRYVAHEEAEEARLILSRSTTLGRTEDE